MGDVIVGVPQTAKTLVVGALRKCLYLRIETVQAYARQWVLKE